MAGYSMGCVLLAFIITKLKLSLNKSEIILNEQEHVKCVKLLKSCHNWWVSAFYFNFNFSEITAFFKYFRTKMKRNAGLNWKENRLTHLSSYISRTSTPDHSYHLLDHHFVWGRCGHTKIIRFSSNRKEIGEQLKYRYQHGS